MLRGYDGRNRKMKHKSTSVFLWWSACCILLLQVQTTRGAVSYFFLCQYCVQFLRSFYSLEMQFLFSLQFHVQIDAAF